MKTKSPIPFEKLDIEIQRGCEKGMWCPTCSQWAKKYRRAMGSPIARFMIDLYRAQQQHERYYTTRELYPRDNKASTEGVLARHWGLIDLLETQNEGGAPAGSFKLTDRGRRFVNNTEYVQAHVYMYNGACLGLDGKLVNIRQALGKKFSYEELMRGV